MNRVFILIGGVALMAILIGCGQDPEQKPPTESPSVSIPPALSPAPRVHPVTQATRDTDCMVLTLTQSGDRDATGPSTECW